MKKLLFLLGLLAGSVQAQDEYYTLSRVVSTATNPTFGTLTVSGWFETSGFGVGCIVGPSNTCPPIVNGMPTKVNPLIVGYDINLTWNGITETLANSGGGLVDYTGMVATAKGLFCNLCQAYGAGFPWFDFGATYGGKGGAANSGVWYQFESYLPAPNGTINFLTAPLKNNYRIGNAPTTTMPGAAMVPAAARATPELGARGAAAALTLLVGAGLLIQGQRRC